jgi:hydrogenase maturation protease
MSNSPFTIHQNLMTQLVIFAYGNPSRGDDALGPQMLDLIENYWQQKAESNTQDQRAEENHIEFIEDFQLQIEHALDLEHRDLALFIDASVSCPHPYCFSRLHPVQDDSYTTHALHPAAVLYVYQQTTAQSPPPAFLLTVRGEAFELGTPLSAMATENLTGAFTFLTQLIENIDINYWQGNEQKV